MRGGCFTRGAWESPGVNNGVLFVWAPQERRIRIEVGTGLEGVLTDVTAGRIVARVRDLFRGGRYAAGVNAAVDGIIGVLGTGQVGGTPVPDQRTFVERNSADELERQRQAEDLRRQAEARRQQEEDAARAASARTRVIDYAVVAVLMLGLYLLYRRWRAAGWQEELPGELTAAAQALEAANQKRAQAQAALADLRNEAPAQICQQFDAAPGSPPDELEQPRSDLEKLRLLPQGTYAELKAAHEGLLHWRERMAITVKGFDEVQGTLNSFRVQREEAQGLLVSVSARLVRMEAEGPPGPAEGLLRAASETYGQAVQKSQEQPANWLLVYDLLADVSVCLDRIENPALGTAYRPVRSWGGDIDSPAADLLAAMYASRAAASLSEGSGGRRGRGARS